MDNIEHSFSTQEIQQFVYSKMCELGIEPRLARDRNFLLDGQIHRYDIVGQKRGSKNGAYLVYPDGVPNIFLQDWSNPEIKHKFSMRPEGGSKVSSFSQLQIHEWRAEQEKRKLEDEKRQLKAADLSRIAFENSKSGIFEHPYLAKKNLATPHGARLHNDGRLIIPLVNINGQITSVQYISSKGEKRFQPDGKIQGSFFQIDLAKLSASSPVVLVGEGYATMCSVYEFCQVPCVAAMSSGNIEAVVQSIILKNPGARIILIADNDLRTQEKRGFNAGLETAEKIYKKYQPSVVACFAPPFEDSSVGSDWNDYINRFGENLVVKKLIRDVKFFGLDEAGRRELVAMERVKSMSQQLSTAIQLPVLDFIGGMFPRGYLSAVVGSAGTGKTMFIQKLASDLSIGGNILDGVVENEPVRRSLIFAAEAGFETLVRRATSLRWGLNSANVGVVDQYSLAMNGMSVMLNEPDGLANVRRFIEVNKPDIVFFDTFMNFHDVDENRGVELKPVLLSLMDLARAFNIAIVLIHHTRKRTAKERMFELNQDDSVGSGVFNRLVSLIIGLEQSQEEDRVISVRILKSWFKKFPAFRYLISENEKGAGVFESFIYEKEDDSSVGSFTAKNVFCDYIRGRFPVGSKFVFDDLDFDVIPNVSVPRARKLLASLVQNGHLKKDGSTRNTVYTVISV